MITWLIIGVIIIAVLAIGFILIPYLSKRGIITTKTAQTTDDLLVIAQSILSTLNINSNTKDKASLVFSIANISVKYVEQTLLYSDNAFKKKAANDTVISILDKIGISVSDDVKALIEIGIESAVNGLPSSNAPYKATNFESITIPVVPVSVDNTPVVTTTTTTTTV